MSQPRRISASQIGTFNDCRRFWWFQRIERLSDGPPQAHFTLGTVLHAVCERWLSADENGRVPMDFIEDGPLQGQIPGEAVDLYPAGWETTFERDGSTSEVTPTEAKLIKRLVAEAIEEGILVREPGTTVERELVVPVVDGVELIGYADVFRDAARHRERPLIEDHKSFGKGSVRYLMQSNPESPNYVGKNEQLKTYAWATSVLDDWDGDVDVCHNQFPKFAGRPVSKATGRIDALQIANHGEYLKVVAGEMVRTSRIKNWDNVPGPADAGKCSRWYGKECPFAGICSHRETVTGYKERSERALENHQSQGRLDLPLPKPKKRGKTAGSVMSLFDKIKADKARQAGTSVKPAAKPASINPEPAQDSAAAPAQAPAGDGAPWATADCSACKGRGVSSKGRGCPMCDAKAKRAKLPTSMHYIIESQDDGTVIATARDGKEEGLEAAGMPLVWVEGEGTAQQDAEEPQEAAQEPEPEEPTVEADAEPEAVEKSAEKPVKAKGKRPSRASSKAPAKASTTEVKAKPKGNPLEPDEQAPLLILVGAMPLRPIEGRKIVTSREMLEAWGEKLAQDMGASSYWDLDPFKRRDRLAAKAPDIVQDSGDVVVIHPGSLANDDTGSFLQALMAVRSANVFVSGS